MFDIRLNEQQRAFQELAREFAQNEIKPRALELDAKPNWEERIPWDALKKGSQLGFRTFVLQEENGGAGASDHLTACVIAEELAAADIGTAYYFMLTARRARDWFELRMTQEQRDYFLPKFLSDDFYFTTVAIHEPDTDLGFDYYTETPENVRLKTRAVEQPDGTWVINGAKNFQTVGYLAKLIVTIAQTVDGPRAFLVEGDSPGLVRHPMSKIGRRVGDNAEIFYDNVRVPKGRILAPNPPGRTDTGTHVTIASLTLGLGRAALEETLKYTQERVAGGKPIIQHQAVGLFLADMATNLEAARRLIWTAAWAKDHPEAFADGSADWQPYEMMALAFTGTAVQRLTEQGMELFGGMGVISGMPIEKYVRDALIQKHISFPFPTRFKITEALAGYKRKVPPFIGNP
ncbi:MAG: acyl-CoA dehydrogenase family protein [Betaproteobacteria bacterium]|nr:MAG: acyl-CoA dehydrogenase family protein [Betaproteobacteria bacterium]